MMTNRPVNEQPWLLRSEHDIPPRGSDAYSALGSFTVCCLAIPNPAIC
jgi:hypothetical protein